MKKCPNCYAHLPNDLESCPMCGTSVKDAEILPDDPKPVSANASDHADSASSDNSAKRFCPFCGKEQPAIDASFCPFCGKELNSNKPQTPPSYHYTPSTAQQTPARKVCPKCGIAYYNRDTCPDCHVALLDSDQSSSSSSFYQKKDESKKMICPKCHSVYIGERAFCPNCHTHMVHYSAYQAGAAHLQNDANGCLIVVAFLLPVIGFIIAAVNYSNGNQNAGGSYLKAAIAGIIVNVVLIILLAACGAFSGPTYYYY